MGRLLPLLSSVREFLMTPFLPENAGLILRPSQYRDLEAIAQLTEPLSVSGPPGSLQEERIDWHQARQWYGLLRLLRWFPNPFQHALCVHVAERKDDLCGMIRIAPVNCTRSTWCVKQVAIAPHLSRASIGSELLRYCFETIWEARTWVLEVDVNDKDALALYRQNGFQPLAQLTYWTITPDVLAQLAQRDPDLPNLLPVSNADAPLLYQLDTAAMPPQVRQVFDRHIDDFRQPAPAVIARNAQDRLRGIETTSGYVFESQRKAAIGYFQVQICRDGSQPHRAELTVHPAYTWLYPELMAQMAKIAREFPHSPLQLVSADYQPEREEYLERIGAERIGHGLMLSRSVWHKLRESRSVALDLQEVLQGLQPAKPVAGRMFWANAGDSLTQSPRPSDRPHPDTDTLSGDRE